MGHYVFSRWPLEERFIFNYQSPSPGYLHSNFRHQRCLSACSRAPRAAAIFKHHPRRAERHISNFWNSASSPGETPSSFQVDGSSPAPEQSRPLINPHPLDLGSFRDVQHVACLTKATFSASLTDLHLRQAPLLEMVDANSLKNFLATPPSNFSPGLHPELLCTLAPSCLYCHVLAMVDTLRQCLLIIG